MPSPASKEIRSGEAKPFAVPRSEMVRRHIAARGVRDELVLEATRNVPRELFLPTAVREFAYEDSPLPIAGEQTISQPYIVAFTAEALLLKGGETVLEIGTGSGYAAAVLSEIAAQVYTVERIGQLAEKAAATLAARKPNGRGYYFEASLPLQFDEYVWFDNTRAITPLDTAEIKGAAGHLSVRGVIQPNVLA